MSQQSEIPQRNSQRLLDKYSQLLICISLKRDIINKDVSVSFQLMCENHTLSRFTNLFTFFFIFHPILCFSLRRVILKPPMRKLILKDTYRERASSNKTRTLSKSINMNIWVVGTSNQLFIRGS